ncbi:hypothetical protein [Rhodococcus artemisiae]|uniref:Transcriptional regulator, AbiEi antitoxin, Type IV TA system n=1 Tax=Rhodococcus artemisiae TaxID=714159 RepID=A0ABU7LFI6_9NOCA|nr:hypothetical protein [Rhodococcus artemisiae]MEE2060293.1 hypothetical protein [Rhodococcus artemisiae]
MGHEPLIHRSEALALGYTPGEIRGFVSTGRWVRLAAGIFLPRDTYDTADDYGRHLFHSLAVVQVASSDTALSHVSAAVLHGLRPWRISLDDVHLTRNRPSGSKRSRGRVMHAARVDECDLREKYGARVLGVARTVLDLAASEPLEQAVVLGDQSLRQGLVDIGELEHAAGRMGSRPGRPRVLRAVRCMSDRSDSVGESRSRVLMSREQLPTPLTQVDVLDSAGRWLARVDFLLPQHGVIGEFDGRIKYRRDGVATTDAEDVVYREKLREDQLRHAGWVVVRWTWADVETPGAVAAKIRGAIALAQRGSGPTGTFKVRRLATQK